MLSLLEIIKKTTEFFVARNVESARLNAELLVGHALGLKRMELYLQFERLLTEAELETIRPLVRRRAQREPLQYILGETDFCGLRLKVDRRALIPRPETELLVERVVAASGASPAAILDLGTGTGAIALALAKQFPEARVTALDRSEDALALARENGERTGLAERIRWLKSDWYSALPADERYDLIVANPPYLTVAETQEAAPEVREFEPVSALIGAGAEGADDLRAILVGARERLSEGGLLAMETGIAQHAALIGWATELGFARTESQQDLTERDRFVFAWR